jgi:hypothetical protein
LIPILAERTQHIRFSTAVVVLPLRNPIQLAEEIAMLDILTKGRIEVGFGTGYQQYEFDRFGVKLEENRAMFEEALSARPSPVTELTPVPGDAALMSWPSSRSFATTMDPMRPVPPMTVIREMGTDPVFGKETANARPAA